ncbi:hypothetical protein AB0H03_02385 [Streptomyces sparsogenes]|uniref:hypothetical protein n=1 Tax=Streptomyces sparsogenes TaxID=67365 RepID=UPI0033E6B38D
MSEVEGGGEGQMMLCVVLVDESRRVVEHPVTVPAYPVQGDRLRVPPAGHVPLATLPGQWVDS